MVRRLIFSCLCLLMQWTHGTLLKQQLNNNIGTLSQLVNRGEHGDQIITGEFQDKVWLMPEEDEFLQNGMNIENREVFRLRELRKKQKRDKANSDVTDVQLKSGIFTTMKRQRPANKETLQLGLQQGLGLSVQTRAKMGLDFVEVVSSSDDEITGVGLLEDEIKVLEQKVNKTDSYESHAALQAAISYLQDSSNTTKKKEEIPKKTDWGIFTYFYNEGKCDYMRSQNLKDGQSSYRTRGNDDAATVFVANGELTRSKGDQVAIEVCQGKALQDGNMKAKTFNEDNIYVVNHEKNSIYNDVTKFPKDKMDDAMKEYNKYSNDDTTILVRGSDSEVLQKRGEDIYVGQNLAYLYNDVESNGQLHEFDLQSLAQKANNP